MVKIGKRKYRKNKAKFLIINELVIGEMRGFD